MISVIVPVWNTPQELNRTLKSLARQTCQDFEVIVVNDGSTKSVDFVISKGQFLISNLKYFKIQHEGAPRARNFGFSWSSGEYVLFCDADMELIPTALKKMKKILDDNQDVDFVYSDFKYGWKKFKFWEFDAEKLKENNYINTCSMLRRDKVVGWDESLRKFQDWDFWLTVVERGGRGKYIPEVLFKANVRSGKISSWLPKVFYKFKFLKKVKQYNKFKKIVQKKHKIS